MFRDADNTLRLVVMQKQSIVRDNRGYASQPVGCDLGAFSGVWLFLIQFDFGVKKYSLN